MKTFLLIIAEFVAAGLVFVVFAVFCAWRQTGRAANRNPFTVTHEVNGRPIPFSSCNDTVKCVMVDLRPGGITHYDYYP